MLLPPLLPVLLLLLLAATGTHTGTKGGKKVANEATEEYEYIYDTSTDVEIAAEASLDDVAPTAPARPARPTRPTRPAAATSASRLRQQQRSLLSDPSLISLLYNRYGEPIFTTRRRRNETILFHFPQKYLPPLYTNFTLENRFGTTNVNIPVPEIEIPDLSLPEQLPQLAGFSLFVPLHRSMAVRLINVLIDMPTFEDFMTVLLYAHARINPQLVNYAQSVAILGRNDTQNMALPNFACVIPDKFISGHGVFSQLRQRASVFMDDERAQVPLEIPRDFTGTDLDIEHRVAYFREDIGINLHHWHWHLVYPGSGPRQVVNKDRRGELFYYMHQQIMARYNFERLSNKLLRAKRLLNWREPIEEAYFPKLDSMLASRVWPARQANAYFQDIARRDEQVFLDVQDLERWRERIYTAIHGGRVQNENGSFMRLDEYNGIDILGNIVEASDLSINQNLYGSLHNMGHVFISYIHDPDERYLESFGVIGDSTTAMRDPAFYRWHSFIDDLFQEHKRTLPSYSKQQLEFDGINITGIQVRSEATRGQANVLHTFWEKSDLDLSRGLDFAPQGPVYVRVTHLQNEPFVYTIKVRNTGNERMGTVRIFMAPKQDERKINLRLPEQRHLFIEMDKFNFKFKRGENTVTRNSDESSVTIPYERTFRDLTQSGPADGTTEEQQFNYCGCGWPQHMLLPKGTPDGFPAQLFVMVSNYADDKVGKRSGNRCQDAHSYCGIRGELYPDRRPMGFPFDRPPPTDSPTLDAFVRTRSNMAAIDVRIQHSERTVVRSG